MNTLSYSGMVKTRWLLSFIIIVITLGCFSSLWVRRYTKVNEIQSLLLHATISASGIDPKDISLLQGSAEDLYNPVYNALKQQLITIKQADPDIKFVYVMGYTPNDAQNLFFYADSEDPASLDYSAPGDIYEDTTDAEYSAFANGKAFTEGPTKDSFGNWVSGFAPLKDPITGETLALVGIDIDAKLWNLHLAEAMLVPILSTVLIILLTLGYFFFRRQTFAYLKEIKESEKELKKQRNRLQALYEISAMRGQNIGEQFHAALAVASKAIGMQAAIITKVVGNKWTILYALQQTSLIQEQKEYTSQNSYESLGFKSSIEIPIQLNGVLFGNLVFLNPNSHTDIVSESNNNFMHLFAQWITSTLERSEIDKMKSEFVSLASHQLNTPLSTIHWFADILLTDEQFPLNTQQKEYVTEIKGAGARMVDLVDALLNVSRIEMGTFSVNPVATDFREIVKNLLNELDHQIQKGNITIIEKYDEHLPSIPADPSLIQIVFQNLITNAIKYNSSPGTLTIKILLNPHYSHSIYCEISDTGLGIPESDRSNIFQKLFRASNAQSKITDGNGLGLYIVKSIIESAEGSIWFTSQENVGTTFCFTMPLIGMKAKKGSKVLSADHKPAL